MMCDRYSDEIKALRRGIEANTFFTKEDVRAFIRDYTKLVYDFKMLGLIYDYYDKNIIYRKENRIKILGVENLVSDLLEFFATFPDLNVDLESLIVAGDADSGYKVWRRMRYHGTNTNHSKFGPPTGKVLGDGCLGLSMMFINRVDGSWKVTEEHNSISYSFIRDVCTSDEA